MRMNRHPIPDSINHPIVKRNLRRLDRIIRLEYKPERKHLARVEALPEHLDGEEPGLEVVCLDEVYADGGLFVLERGEFLGWGVSAADDRSQAKARTEPPLSQRRHVYTTLRMNDARARRATPTR